MPTKNCNCMNLTTFVDWGALGRHHRHLSWQRCATRLKMIFRWASTNVIKFVTCQSNTPLCPLYQCGDKMVAHMLQFPSPTAIKGRKIALANLEESLHNMGTHPDITSLIALTIGSSDRPMCDNSESDIDLKNILNAQTDIGWDLLRFGFVAMAWKNAQHKWA